MRLDVGKLFFPFAFLVLSCLPVTSAVDLNQCRSSLIQEWAAWNTTQSSNVSSYPTPAWQSCSLNPSDVFNKTLTLDYRQCICKCGAGPGNFTWTLFSQSFSSWLLPWMALMFQLPFGSEDRFDNVVSVLLSIGSPALAGYSLAITRLNNLWLAKEISKIRKYHNIEHVAAVVATLQHIPIKFSNSIAPLASIIVLPENDKWWEYMAKMSKQTRQWNVPTAMNIVWVVIAFVLTLIDSFADFGNFMTVPGDTGYAILAVWFYLLPLVVGWLQVGSQPKANHLRDAFAEADSRLYTPASKSSLESGALERPIDYASPGSQPFLGDEGRSAPIFNYSRVFVWSRQAEFLCLLYRNASAKAHENITVNGRHWSFSSGNFSRNQMGSENEVVEYCLGDNPPRSNVDFHQSISTADFEEYVSLPPWAPNVLQRAFIAAILGLGLQWGTTGAAILIHYETPPKGMGCRSLTFILYGLMSTVVFLFVFLASILSHCARIRPAPSGSQEILDSSARALRWLGKFLGILTGLGFIIACLMMLSGAYDSCFCSSTIFGSAHGLVSFLDPSSVKASSYYKFWIGGSVMAVSSTLLYAAGIYFAAPVVR